MRKIQLMIKRLMDLLISTSLLIAFSPLWFIIAALIKLESEGPVMFLQERPGKDRKIFRVFKFRTMQLGSEKMVKGKEVMKDDPRVTAVGRVLRRTKLDEIPKLINVLIGDMSLVGPRPERISSLEDYDSEISKRLNMRQGLTGLAQVSGNIYLDLQDRYKYDVYYVENYCLLLDIKILFRTVGVVLFGEDRYVNKELVNIIN